MANIQKPTIQLKVDIPGSVQSINNDIKTIESQLKPIIISANINSDAIKQQTQQIQSQLNSVVSQFKNENIDFGANLDTTKIQKSGQTIQEVSDKVAILAQQMQILQARAENAGISLNQIQVDKFTNLLNNFKIPEATTELKELRNEYSLLNVEMSKQLPENAIENMATSAKNLEAQIGTIESKFSTISLGNSSNWSSQVEQVDANVQQLRTNLDAFNNAQMGQDKVQAFNTLNSSVKETKTQVDNLTKSQKALAGVDITSNKLEAYLNDNEKVAAKFPNEVNAIKASLQSLGNETDTTKLTTGLQNVNKQFTDLKASAQAAGAEGRTVLGELGNDIKKMATWAIGGTAIFGTINEIKQMISNVKDLSKATVNLQIASGYNNQQMSQLMTTYSQMGQQLGATTTEVADSADAWLRQGKSVEESNTLIKDSMMLSKLGEIDSADATQYLTSAMKGYGVSVNDTLGIVDKLTKVDQISATSAGGLAEGMSKTANAANLAGVSMDKLIGYEAVIGETTQKSMDEVGTSLQAIFSRMGNVKAGKFTDDQTGEALNDVESVLGKVGIQLRDSNGQFKNFGTVLDTVASKWKSYDSVQQNALATAIAGVRQRENFLVLMSNYNTALKYQETAENSAGTATEKMQYYQQGLEAHTKAATAAFEQLSKTVINSDVFKGVVDAGTGFLNVLNTIVSKLGTVPTLIAGISAGASLLGKNAGKEYAHLLKVA